MTLLRDNFSAGPSANATVPNKQNANVIARIGRLGPAFQTRSIGRRLRIDQADQEPGRAAEERENQSFGE